MSTPEPTVTITGNISAVDLRFTKSGKTVASFGLASPNRSNNQTAHGPTTTQHGSVSSRGTTSQTTLPPRSTAATARPAELRRLYDNRDALQVAYRILTQREAAARKSDTAFIEYDFLRRCDGPDRNLEPTEWSERQRAQLLADILPGRYAESTLPKRTRRFTTASAS